MKFENVYLPYGAYWSTPFCRWQGSLSALHPLEFSAEVGRRALAERRISCDQLDSIFLGTTVPSPGSFYGAPWVASMLGAPGLTGPTIAQACATSARLLTAAATEVECMRDRVILCLAADRTSNGPHLVYPDPRGPGGRPISDDWVWNNFNCDPLHRESMLQTAERVAAEEGITRREQDEVAWLRFEQYQDALAGDSAFLRRFMTLPLEVPIGGRRTQSVTGDEGVTATSREKLAGLRPLLEGGSVTYGGQTFPADGNAGMIVTGRSQARELSARPELEVRLLAAAEGRVGAGLMPRAPVPAARAALQAAGLQIRELAAVKTHNPFAVNDVYFSRQLEIPLESFNRYGSSLIWGHPQAPTGLRLTMELIEELALRGGGYGLFSGCAAGDTAAAIVLRVG